jgi:uncharacterized protein
MLLDTSGLLCCLDADDIRHSDAVNFYRSSSIRLTHNYVIAELIALTQARRLPRESSLRFAEAVTTDADVEVVWVDADLHAAAMRLLESQLDKAYSICDAISFILMERRSLNEALTTDRHFEQAGLTA